MESDAIEIEENNQPSQGGLIAHEQSFETIEEKIEEIDVSEIQPFTIIPDYRDAPDSRYPFVVKTPSSVVCIDGWNLVQEAKVGGNPAVTCKVEYMREHSDEELAIRKVAIRLRPKGGTGSYAETVRNTKRLMEILLASDRDLKLFHHGGDRKGVGFVNNRQDNVIKVLSFRLGMSTTTVNQYLNYSRYLDDDTLNFFAVQGVGRDFFEEAQKNKRVQIDRLKIRRMSAPDITTQISTDMREWHEEYRQTGKITSILDIQENDAEGEAEAGAENECPDYETSEETVPAPEPEAFRPWYGYPPGNEEDSFENIKLEFEPSARRLLEAFAFTDPEEFRRVATEEIRHLCRLPSRVLALKPSCLRTESHQGEGLQ